MGWHVVRAFVAVNEAAVAVRHKAGEEDFEVAPDLRLVIFTENQRCRGVMQKNVANARIHARLAHILPYGLGDFVGATPLGADAQAILPHDHGEIPLVFGAGVEFAL